MKIEEVTFSASAVTSGPQWSPPKTTMLYVGILKRFVEKSAGRRSGLEWDTSYVVGVFSEVGLLTPDD